VLEVQRYRQKRCVHWLLEMRRHGQLHGLSWQRPHLTFANRAEQIVGRERRERVSHHNWSGDA